MATAQEIKEDVVEFLKENSTAVIATAFNDDPRASTVYFCSDDDLNFYFVTKRKTSKYYNSSINPKVAVVVGTGPEHISVQAHGKIDLIVNDEEKQKVVDLLIGKQNLLGIKLWPIDELENLKDAEKVLFKIVPDELTYLNIDGAKHPATQSNELIKVI